MSNKRVAKPKGTTLEGKVAVVAGASRGAGRGIALALGEAGATVYAVARTVRGGPKPADGAPGTVDDVAEEISALGGTGIAVRADCAQDEEVAALFERVEREQGRLDILALAVWGGADAFPTFEAAMAAWGQPFWEQPAGAWSHVMGAPHAYLLTASHAARLMAKAKRGLIAGVTDGIIAQGSEDADSVAARGEYQGGLLWDLAHRTINTLMRHMSVEAKPRGIAVVTLMPGFMQTERVLRHLTSEKLKKQFRFDLSESTRYVGRAVAALAADRQVLKKTGRIHFVADLAAEYGFTDVDGRQVPRFKPFG